jgi:hypothetical protein
MAWKLRKGSRQLIRTVLSLLPWLVSALGAYAMTSYLHSSEYLSGYWRPFFPARDEGAWAWLRRTRSNLLEDPLAAEHGSVLASLLLIGGLHLIRTGKQSATHVLGFLASGVFFAVASLYPLVGRVTIYVAPLVAVVVAAALPVSPAGKPRAQALLGAVGIHLVFGSSLTDGLASSSEREVLEESRPVLREVVVSAEAGDRIVVDTRARPAVAYNATQLEGLTAAGVLDMLPAGERPCNDAAELESAGFTSTRVWRMFSHRSPAGPYRLPREKVPRRVAKVATLTRLVSGEGAAAAYLYKPRVDPRIPAEVDRMRCLRFRAGIAPATDTNLIGSR